MELLLSASHLYRDAVLVPGTHSHCWLVAHPSTLLSDMWVWAHSDCVLFTIHRPPATVLTLITVPIQERLSRRQMGLMGEVMKSSDKRIRLLTEIMQGIRVIKFFSWSGLFHATAEWSWRCSHFITGILSPPLLRVVEITSTGRNRS